MIWKRKLLTGEELKKRADELGVYSLNVSPSLLSERVSDVELQRRVMEAERHVREHRLWIVAALSMVISVISAITAWVALDASKEASRDDRRAWIGIKGATGTRETNAGGNVFLWSGSDNRLGVLVTNYGRTPALDVHGCVRTTTVGKSESFVPPPCFHDPNGSIGTIDTETKVLLRTKHFIMGNQQLDQLKSSEEIMYLHGWIKYKDIFQRPHGVTFCYVLSPDLSGFHPYNKYNDSN